MDEMPGWQIVPRATMQTDPRDPAALAQYPTKGLPVRLFVCRECGYVEMYAGPVLAPAPQELPGG